ncbi:MAG: LamG domain-containing protein, partial [Candidatus Aenigmarchaeota archaeon]|nr:LamG domain-containing protein [Candidatus Aenigmarchaeota archaeon]
SSNYVWRIRNNVLDMGWNFAGAGGNWNYVNGTTTVNDGNWHFVAFVSNGIDRNKIYLDGIEQTTTFTSTSGSINDKGWTGNVDGVASYNHHINIGGLNRGTSPTNWFNGTIDHVRIWKTALSPEEIVQQMSFGGSAANLNDDNIFDMADLIIVSTNFGKNSGFDLRADTDNNGEIDIFDMTFVASRFT